MYRLIKKALFQMDAEKVHEWIMDLCHRGEGVPGFGSLVEGLYGFEDPRLEVRIGDLRFPNPVGLAAGYDKNAMALGMLQGLGFGAIEVGTVTPRPQEGNTYPRLFRLPKEKAIINRMGFNNLGIEEVASRVDNSIKKVPIGINIGKNKDTPIDSALDDYLVGMKKAWEAADYIAVNISSPNTPGLRSLQKGKNLENLLRRILEQKEELTLKTGLRRQIWLKVDPDLKGDEIDLVSELALLFQIDALILTNTTLSRPGIEAEEATQTGGLSGKPLFDLSNEVLCRVFLKTRGSIPLIGVGGVFSANDAYQKIMLGASMVQIYTGLVFQGPKVVKNIKKGLSIKLEHEHCPSIMERVGVLV